MSGEITSTSTISKSPTRMNASQSRAPERTCSLRILTAIGLVAVQLAHLEQASVRAKPSFPPKCPAANANAGISNIVYRNIYTWSSNQMFMIKSNGGSGTMQNCQFNNFIGHSNAYSLDLNAYWSSMKVVDGAGVSYKNLTFNNWKGTCANGAQRGPIQVICPSGVPCTGITVSDFAMWTDTGSTLLNKCQNSFGSGGCLKSGSPSSYTTTQTVNSAP